jgi:manganese/zinc/iron transport system ATP- binding protein
VLATVGMVADVAAEVGGDCVAAEALIGPGSDPHLYQPTASDVGRLAEADLILTVGHGLEGQLGAVLARFADRTASVAVAEAGFEEASLIEAADFGGGIDPHLWMDAGLWAGIAAVIAEAVGGIAPGCAEAARANAAAYAATLEALDGWVEASVATIPEGQRVLVTAHDAFAYFGRAYGLDVVAIQGISTEAEASIADIRAAADAVVEAGVPAVFVETTINPRAIEAVIEAAGARGHAVEVGGALFSDAMGDAGTAEGTYIGMLVANARAITEALGGTPPPLPAALDGWAAEWEGTQLSAIDPGGTAAPLHEPQFALHVEDLTVSFRDAPVLWDIDLDVPPGVMAAIVGPNGAGKSTLIKTALGLVRPVAGHVRFFGRRYRDEQRRVGYVPQRSTVDWDFPATALDVVTMGLYGRLGWFRRPGRAERGRAMAALEEVGMADYAGRQISQLSGGQQQRVFIARALVQEADLYFLDEPLAGVDATTERAIVALLQGLRARGKTVIVVHHDLQTVRRYFDWLVMLNVRVIAQGAGGGGLHAREPAQDLRRADRADRGRPDEPLRRRAMNGLVALAQDHTVQTVVLGAAILGVVSGVLGSFAVLGGRACSGTR